MKAKNTLASATVAAGLVFFSAIASAQRGDAFDVIVYNDTRDPIVQFSTLSPNGEWRPRSGSWLKSPINGGERATVRIRFAANSECGRTYFVRTQSGREFKSKHNFCTHHGIHVHADRVVGTPN